MKKIYLLLLFPLLVSRLWAADYLLSGVDLDDNTSYYDFNKASSSDSLLCWVYAAANVLQYWQDKQSDDDIDANDIPDGNTMSDAYVSDIVTTFQSAWGNAGGYEINAFEWWLTDVAGVALTQEDLVKKSATFPEGGGYWSDYVSTGTYIGAETVVYASESSYFLSLMNEAIDNDYGMTLGIYDETSADNYQGHAITLWGYGYDEEAGTYYVYVTDSDDNKDGMQQYTIEYLTTYEGEEYNNSWFLTDYGSSNADWFIGCMTTLEVGVLTVPEPATTSLAFIALVSCLGRRRRKA